MSLRRSPSAVFGTIGNPSWPGLPPRVTRNGGPILLAFLSTVALSAATERQDGRHLLGTPAPPLGLEHWIGSEPLEIKDLRGEVVLIRWLTDDCPYCSTTAPVLRDLHRTYGGRGLRVIAVFHPKPPGDPDPDRARSLAARFGFEFPVALDPDWSALRRWWLGAGGRGWTSAAFLIDRQGTIRYVHPGGEFHPGPGGDHQRDHRDCNREYDAIIRRIEELLAGLPAGRGGW